VIEPIMMRNRFVLSVVLTMLAMPCLSLSCWAQHPAAPQPANDKPAATLKIQAREVVLPVTVRDKKGALVTSLKISDFALTEDGRPQTIKSFTRESNLPFRLGLLVDTSRSVSGAMDSERKAAGKFVDAMLPADPKSTTQKDEAFLIHFDHEVELLEDFTNSREKLHHELDDMGPTRAAQNSNGPETSDSDSGSRGGGGQSRRGGGTQLYDAIYLSSGADLMLPKDGRKALIVFSDGVDRGSKETLIDAVDAADRLSRPTARWNGRRRLSGWRRVPGRLSRRRWWTAPRRLQRACRGWQEDHGKDCHADRRPVFRGQEKRQPGRDLRSDRRGVARAIFADLHAGHGGQRRRIP
jgi:hypothetical protein